MSGPEKFIFDYHVLDEQTHMVREGRSGFIVIAGSRSEARTAMIKALQRWMGPEPWKPEIRSHETVFIQP